MIRRFLTRILITILIAVCVLNWLQIQQLQSQVAALQASTVRSKPKSKIDVPEAGLSLFELQTQWKHLGSRIEVFRTAR